MCSKNILPVAITTDEDCVKVLCDDLMQVLLFIICVKFLISFLIYIF